MQWCVVFTCMLVCVCVCVVLINGAISLKLDHWGGGGSEGGGGGGELHHWVCLFAKDTMNQQI